MSDEVIACVHSLYDVTTNKLCQHVCDVLQVEKESEHIAHFETHALTLSMLTLFLNSFEQPSKTIDALYWPCDKDIMNKFSSINASPNIEDVVAQRHEYYTDYCIKRGGQPIDIFNKGTRDPFLNVVEHSIGRDEVAAEHPPIIIKDIFTATEQLQTFRAEARKVFPYMGLMLKNLCKDGDALDGLEKVSGTLFAAIS